MTITSCRHPHHSQHRSPLRSLLTLMQNRFATKFCSKCRFVLSFDAFNETMEQKSKELQEAENAKKELAALKAKQEETTRKQQQDIENIEVQLKNNDEKVSKLLEMLSDIQ